MWKRSNIKEVKRKEGKLTDTRKSR